jgi:hypothetical protein
MMNQSDNTNPKQRMQVDISLATDVVCSSCGNQFFQPVLMCKKLSALVSPSGEEILIPIETAICTKCGNINEEFDPSKKM